jgi:hypothetical protein
VPTIDYRRLCSKHLQAPERRAQFAQDHEYSKYKKLKPEQKAEIRAQMTPEQLNTFDQAGVVVDEVRKKRLQVKIGWYGSILPSLVVGGLGSTLSPVVAAVDGHKASRQLGKSQGVSAGVAALSALGGLAVPFYGQFVLVDASIDLLTEKVVGKDKLHAERQALRDRSNILKDVLGRQGPPPGPYLNEPRDDESTASSSTPSLL